MIPYEEVIKAMRENHDELIMDAINHFQVTTEDIPTRVRSEIGPEMEIVYIDDKPAIEINRELHFKEGKFSVKYRLLYLSE